MWLLYLRVAGRCVELRFVEVWEGSEGTAGQVRQVAYWMKFEQQTRRVAERASWTAEGVEKIIRLHRFPSQNLKIAFRQTGVSLSR